jgi:hypothetical protein
MAELRQYCRLLLVCLVLAIKFVEDEVFTNTFYAKAGGVPSSVLQQMEVYAFVTLGYLLNVPQAELQAALNQVNSQFSHHSFPLAVPLILDQAIDCAGSLACLLGLLPYRCQLTNRGGCC